MYRKFITWTAIAVVITVLTTTANTLTTVIGANTDQDQPMTAVTTVTKTTEITTHETETTVTTVKGTTRENVGYITNPARETTDGVRSIQTTFTIGTNLGSSTLNQTGRGRLKQTTYTLPTG